MMDPELEASANEDENDALLGRSGRSKSLISGVSSQDQEESSVYHSASSKVTSVGVTGTINRSGGSVASNWQSPLKQEKKSGFVTLNPFTILLEFRKAKILTVEPVIFLYMFGTYLFFPLYQQFFFLQFAKQIIGNSSILPNGSYCLSSNETDHYGGNGTSTKVEALSNYMNIYLSLANQVPSIIFTLIYGPLSDRIGRRPIMILVASGAIIQGLLALGIVYWELSVYFFILGGLVSGVCGDFASLLMASFSYISDVSSGKWRTYRIGLAEAMLFMAGALAEGGGGIWFQKLNCNFLPPIGLFIGCNTLLIAYVIIFLPRALTQKEKERRALNKPKGILSLIRGFKIYLCQIEEYAVWILWASLIAIFVLVMTSAGSQRIAVFFFKAKEPFDWDPETIGYYQMTSQVSHMLGLLVVLPILVALKLPDALISLIGLAFNAGMNVFTGLAKVTYEMFIIGAIQGVEAIVFPPLRSIQSKTVDVTDQGALFSVVASVEVAATLASGLIFPFILPVTLENGLSPGLAYLVMASLCIIPLPLLLLLLFCRKKKKLCHFKKKQRELPPAVAKHQTFIKNDPAFLSGNFSSVNEQDSLLVPGHRGTYPYYNEKRDSSRVSSRAGVKSMI